MEEIWIPIEEFPMYGISNLGRVQNYATGRILRQSVNKAGIVKVGLVKGKQQYARSVKVLVAEAFVEGCTDLFDTPIHLDGDQQNNRANNIAWRPRWFAWKYARQFDQISIHHRRGPVLDKTTGEWHKCIFDAATNNGMLVQDIWICILKGDPVFPTWHLFTLHK